MSAENDEKKHPQVDGFTIQGEGPYRVFHPEKGSLGSIYWNTLAQIPVWRAVSPKQREHQSFDTPQQACEWLSVRHDRPATQYVPAPRRRR